MASSGAQLVECVPNVSEGRRASVVEALASAIRETAGCRLLDVDAGESSNRTVYTFVGDREAVVNGAVNLARAAFELVDMRRHHGEHPRIGAIDVCPFVPVANVTMEECVTCSKEFGRRLSSDLGVPVFLYAEAQAKDYRKALSDIRHGEYEGLEMKLKDPLWAPDYGQPSFIPAWGATVTGARKILVAYNVNLLATKQQANRIALNIRETGKRKPSRLKCVKALGWYLEEKDIAQVSMNLTDIDVTPPHTAFEQCCKDAKALNLAVVGSEIVGLVPLRALLMAAEFYMEREGLFVLHERQKVMLAVERLGLSSLGLFNPEEKIIEYRLGSNKDGPLVSSTLRAFVESLGARTSAPGGGSASASVASIGAALGTMVGLLTFGNRKFEDLDPVMRVAIPPLHQATQQLLPLVDRDTEAFGDYMEALKLPQNTEEEKKSRQSEMTAGLKKAIDVPLTMMRVAGQCWPHFETLAEHGNITTVSDLQVGCQCLDTGIHGAYHNVMINLKQMNDRDYAGTVTAECEAMVLESTMRSGRVLDLLSKRQEGGEAKEEKEKEGGGGGS